MKYRFDWNKIPNSIVSESLNLLVSRGYLAVKKAPFVPLQFSVNYDTIIRVYRTNEYTDVLADSGYDIFNDIMPQIFSDASRPNEEKSAIPTSDRVVSPQDNQDEVAQMLERLEALEKAVEQSTKNDFEERDYVKAEITFAISLLSKARVLIDLWKERTFRISNYLLNKFGDTAVGICAAEVIKFLGSFFT